MRDRGIRQEAFHVGLRQGGQVSPSERRNRDAGDEVHPRDVCAAKYKHQPQKQSETCGLGGDAHISRDWRRCTLIHIRRPLVKRHCANLEEQACEDRDKSKNSQPIRRSVSYRHPEPVFESRANLPDVCRGPHLALRKGAEAVKQREAISEDCGAEGAEQDVFQCGFIRTLFAAEKTGEHVEAERHRFQAEEHHDQVYAGGHKHHTDAGKEQKRVVFAFLLLFDLQVFHGQENHQRGGGKEKRAKKNKERIDDRGLMKS